MTYNSSFTGAQVDGAVTDVQAAKAASAVDTTAKRLLKVGDFGVGGKNTDFTGTDREIIDFNSVTTVGFYAVNNSALNAPSNWDVSAKGSLIVAVEGGTGNRVNQFATQGYTTQKTWFRSQSIDATWSPWRELYHTGNTPILPNATNLILDSGARLGIGTGTPAWPLDVIGGIRGTALICDRDVGVNFANGGDTNSVIKAVAGTGNMDYDAFNNHAFYTNVGGRTERLRIDPNGNVIKGGASGPLWAHGTGSPEGVVAAPAGSFYSRTDGGAGTSFYVKESSTGNTGWVAK